MMQQSRAWSGMRTIPVWLCTTNPGVTGTKWTRLANRRAGSGFHGAKLDRGQVRLRTKPTDPTHVRRTTVLRT
jgi:hypothetical protein